LMLPDGPYIKKAQQLALHTQGKSAEDP